MGVQSGLLGEGEERIKREGKQRHSNGGNETYAKRGKKGDVFFSEVVSDLQKYGTTSKSDRKTRADSTKYPPCRRSVRTAGGEFKECFVKKGCRGIKGGQSSFKNTKKRNIRAHAENSFGRTGDGFA